MSRLFPTTLGLGAGLLLGVAHASPAHVHGEGQLDIAVEGSQMSMMLSLPSDTVVGFEHAPEDAAQREAVESATRRLSSAPALVSLYTEAGCTAGAAQIELPASFKAADLPHDRKHHDHHDLHDHHDEGHEAHGDHDHDEHDANESGHAHEHADWQLSLEVSCTQMQRLDHIDFSPLFDALPRLETLRVQYIGPQGQTGAELTPASRSLSLPAR